MLLLLALRGDFYLFFMNFGGWGKWMEIFGVKNENFILGKFKVFPKSENIF